MLFRGVIQVGKPGRPCHVVGCNKVWELFVAYGFVCFEHFVEKKKIDRSSAVPKLCELCIGPYMLQDSPTTPYWVCEYHYLLWSAHHGE